MKEKHHPPGGAELRRRAEELARQRASQSPKKLEAPALEETMRTLHELEARQIELERQNDELRQARAESAAQRERYFELFDLAPVGYCLLSKSGVILEANFATATLLGTNRHDLVKQPLARFILKQDQDIHYRSCQELFKTGARQECELRMVKLDGAAFWSYMAMTAAKDDLGSPVCRVVLSDVSERKSREDEAEFSMRMVAMVNTAGDFRERMSKLTASLQGWSGCEAVGIRLRSGEDYPYFETRGFPPTFVEAEKRLCAQDAQGNLLRDGQGDPVLECMCGNVLCGRFDPTKAFFTAQGSFWTNNTTALLASTTEADRQARTRNRCNGEGYESVALIPLRSGPRVLGLLQFNDHRPNRFTPTLIEHFQRTADTLAIVLSQRHAEEALRESEERHRTILQTAMDGFLLLDMQACLLEVNESYCRMSGYTKQELLTMRVPDLEVVEKQADTLARIQKIKTRGEDRFLSQHRRKNGSIFDVEVSIQYRPGEGGRLVVFLQDVTERNRAEAALRSNQVMLSRTESIAHVGSWEWDVATDTATWSDEMFRIFQRTPSDGAPSFAEHPKYYYQEDMRRLKVAVDAAITDGTPYELELRVIREDGETRVCLARGYAEMASGKSVSRLFGSFQDITDRKRLEEVLRRTQFSVDNASDLIAWIRQDGTYAYVNNAASKLLGYSRKELLAKATPDINSGMTLDKWRTKWEQLRRHGSLSYESVFVAKDGQRIPMEATLNFVEYEGEELACGFARDITERKKAEETLRQTNKLLQESQIIAGLGSFVLDVPAGLWRSSAVLDELFGIDEAYERSVDGWVALIHPDDRATMLDHLRNEVLGQRRAFDKEYRIIRPDNQVERWIHGIGKVEFDSQGQPLKVYGTIQDITDRKRAEEALRAIEAEREKALTNYQMLFNRMIDGFALHEIICNQEGEPIDYRFLSINPAFENITSLKVEAVVGHTVREIIPNIEPFWIQTFGRVALTGEPTSFEHYEKDLGRHFEVTAFCPAANQFACVFVDITDRKQAEDKLKRLNRELRAIGDCHQALLRAKDEPSLLTEICRIICDAADYRMAWVGFTRQDERKSVKPVAWGGAVEGYLDNIDITWADDARGRGLTGTCIRTGAPCYVNDFAADPRTKLWHQRALERNYQSAIALPLSAEDGNAFGALTIYSSARNALTEDEIRLLTDLAKELAFGISNLRLKEQSKQAQADLRTLSQAVKQSPASIVITDPSGAIEYVNPKFTRVTGYSMEEVSGKNPRVLKGDKTPQEEYHRLWQNITHGQEWKGEFRNRKKNGEFYWEYASISPILDAEGRISHFLAVKEDITDRKVLEQSFRQAQKMEAIGQLAGGVAHDYNNMLASLMLHLGFFQQREDLDQETKEMIAELLQDAKRTANLTRQLLMFSSKSVMQVKPLDLNIVVANLLKMLKRLIGEHVAIGFETNAAAPCIEADPGMVEQVLMNLCVNGRDAMPKGGQLSIRVESVNMDEERIRVHPGSQTGLYASLSVADTGCGMDEATLQHIFEPFFTTKGPGKGTGLGLATVYGIAAQHKGWVEVQSEVGKGATFNVFFPATTKPLSESSPAEETAPVPGHETILLVEDEAGLRRVVRQVLSKLGYRVLEASHGREALNIWQQQSGNIDLLISDMVMPEGMTGLDLAEQLRKQQPTLKVIISSGYNPEMAGQTRSTVEGILYLQKPYQITALSKMIRRCLDGR